MLCSARLDWQEVHNLARIAPWTHLWITPGNVQMTTILVKFEYWPCHRLVRLHSPSSSIKCFSFLFLGSIVRVQKCVFSPRYYGLRRRRPTRGDANHFVVPAALWAFNHLSNAVFLHPTQKDLRSLIVVFCLKRRRRPIADSRIVLNIVYRVDQSPGPSQHLI